MPNAQLAEVSSEVMARVSADSIPTWINGRTRSGRRALGVRRELIARVGGHPTAMQMLLIDHATATAASWAEGRPPPDALRALVSTLRLLGIAPDSLGHPAMVPASAPGHEEAAA